MQLYWIKSEGNDWLRLPFNFASVTPTTGVYVIWHSGQTPWTVRVGQGDIADRLSAHSRDQEITRYGLIGPLRVTWAAVQAPYLDGVERYLATRLCPLVGDRPLAVNPVPVNLPWAA